jgi:type III pantothenate kinase
MKLVADIGNSNIVFGVFENKWKHIWRLETKKDKSALYYSLKLNELLWEVGIDMKDIEFKVLSSVVPSLKDIIVEVLEKLNDNPLVVLDKNIYDKLNINIKNPLEMGTDLVANAIAAHKLYNENLIIVDFGTALTFTVMDEAGNILGVNIAPGLKTAVNALIGNTAQLPKVKLEFPVHPIGGNTVEAIQNGVLIGYIGLVKYMIKVIKNYLGSDYKTVVTGGLSSVIAPNIGEIDFVEPNLTLYGLLYAGESFLGQ